MTASQRCVRSPMSVHRSIIELGNGSRQRRTPDGFADQAVTQLPADLLRATQSPPSMTPRERRCQSASGNPGSADVSRPVAILSPRERRRQSAIARVVRPSISQWGWMRRSTNQPSMASILKHPQNRGSWFEMEFTGLCVAWLILVSLLEDEPCRATCWVPLPPRR